MNFVYVFVSLLGLAALARANVIYKPVKQSSVQAGYIFFQGAYIPASSYNQYALQLQAKFNGSLWVALSEFPKSLPDPVLTKEILGQIITGLRNAGFKFNASTPFFLGGHSLGGAVMEVFAFDLKNLPGLPFNLTGMVFEGAFVRRSNREKAHSPLLPPVLTVGAELDGLARCTRMAESFYFDSGANNLSYVLESFAKPRRADAAKSYTMIIPGMNHYQFAGEGVPPSFVVKNDIKPEISNESARDSLTSLVASFFQLRLGVSTSQDIEFLANMTMVTYNFTQPIIQTFEMEGFYHFSPPCYKDKSLRPPNCTAGSQWSVIAQEIMAGAMLAHLNVTNEFHPVAQIPDHFPSINNNCSQSQQQPCVLSITSTTENTYETLDSLDRGIDAVAAVEAKTKLKSRQAVYEALTGQKYDFNQTDGESLCALINQEAINQALFYAGLPSVKRYFSTGKMLSPVEDKQVKSGPTWIESKLTFEPAVDPSTNRTYVNLQSASLKLSTDNKIKAIAGVHYCKLITIARALEWIYVDALKP